MISYQLGGVKSLSGPEIGQISVETVENLSEILENESYATYIQTNKHPSLYTPNSPL